MKKIQFSIHINAPKEKVWKTMLEDETYREWTAVFNPEGGSYFEGEWKEGSEMQFIGPSENGKQSGMYSKIKAVRPNEFLSIQHLGEIIDGEVKPWPGQDPNSESAFENYTFIEKDGGTDLIIDLDTEENFEKMFQDMWPKALQTLKELSEK